MNSIHAIPPSVGQIFIAVASDKSGALIWKCVAVGLYLQAGEYEPETDEGIMLEGSEWCPVDCAELDVLFKGQSSDA